MKNHTPNLQTIINNSLAQSMPYNQYMDLVAKMVENNSTTGAQKTEALANYTKLNHKRMLRWNKTLKISEEATNKIKAFNKKTTWLVITESWCGDAAHLLPVFNKVATLNESVNLKVVLRDDNEALMQAFLTNGNKAIPKLIMIDNATNKVVTTYGPRPSVATKMVKDFKDKHDALTSEFKEDLQRWYNKDKGQTTLNDLVGLLI